MPHAGKRLRTLRSLRVHEVLGLRPRPRSLERHKGALSIRLSERRAGGVHLVHPHDECPSSRPAIPGGALSSVARFRFAGRRQFALRPPSCQGSFRRIPPHPRATFPRRRKLAFSFGDDRFGASFELVLAARRSRWRCAAGRCCTAPRSFPRSAARLPGSRASEAGCTRV